MKPRSTCTVGERARQERAEEWARCKIREEVKKAGRMSQGQAQDARHDAALKVQGAWSGGCKRPVEMGGGIFVGWWSGAHALYEGRRV